MLTLHELNSSQSSVQAFQGGTWTIDSITNAVVVSATNLDIRDLAFATDKVDVGGSVIALDAPTLAALENITVSATALDIRALAFATDKVDVGGSIIALDSTTLAALETINVIEAPYATWKTSQQTVAITATQIAATALTGRKRVIVQNIGSKDVYLKNANTVAVATDGKLSKGASFEMQLDATAAIWAIGDGGTSDIRVWEFAA